MGRPVISLLTDFGARDPSAAICRGVMLGIAGDAQIIDITHEVRKWAIRDGAFLLANALPYLPVGVHVAVVDPGVGTARRPIGVLTGRGDILVGPDNGLLVPAAERLGGIVEARELTERSLWLAVTAPRGTPATSATFHGRDIFSPVAAHLAAGTPFAAVGAALDPATLTRLPWPGAEVTDGELRTAVLYIDSFGNVKLGGLAAELRRAIGELRPGDRLMVGAHGALGAGGPTRGGVVLPWAAAFGDVAPGEALLYEDSFGRLSLAANQASAAAVLGLAEDDPLLIRRAEGSA